MDTEIQARIFPPYMITVVIVICRDPSALSSAPLSPFIFVIDTVRHPPHPFGVEVSRHTTDDHMRADFVAIVLGVGRLDEHGVEEIRSST